MHGSLRWLSAFLLLLGAVDSPAQPANDSWANRTPVTKPFPFVVHEPDMYLATIDAANDPVPPCLVTVSTTLVAWSTKIGWAVVSILGRLMWTGFGDMIPTGSGRCLLCVTGLNTDCAKAIGLVGIGDDVGRK